MDFSKSSFSLSVLVVLLSFVNEKRKILKKKSYQRSRRYRSFSLQYMLSRRLFCFFTRSQIRTKKKLFCVVLCFVEYGEEEEEEKRTTNKNQPDKFCFQHP